ncbi:MAG: hypothetical protein IKY94_05425 [Lachnospiraceae bacterium]|nr:hypothetical protein [Lachnospiraceae bacterium]
MKHRILLLTLILSLSFTLTACNKEDKPVPETSTVEDTVQEEISTSTTESTSDSQGTDVQLSEDELDVKAEDNASATTVEQSADLSGLTEDELETANEMKELLDLGLISQEEYDEAIDVLKNGIMGSGSTSSSSSNAGSYTQQQLNPEQQAAVEEMYTTGKDTEHRTNIDYSAPSNPELAGYRIN